MQQHKQLAKTNQVSELDMARTASGGQLGHGQSLMKVGGQYQTAISVQVKRDIGTVQNPGGQVLQRALVEASLLGDRYAYGWEVNDRQSGGKKAIEGVSVDGAYMLLRAWGNAVCDVDLASVDEEAYTFKATFVDLESGATCSRLYRQHRSAPPGKYDQQRWDDMAFSNGQSRAVRNVICAALPQWLQDRCMDAAARAADRSSQPEARQGGSANRAESAELAQGFANRLRAAWGKDELGDLASQIKAKESAMTREDVAQLRDIYRRQLSAWEQGNESVAEAEFEETSKS
jgi:hypothetical protein